MSEEMRPIVKNGNASQPRQTSDKSSATSDSPVASTTIPTSSDSRKQSEDEELAEFVAVRNARLRLEFRLDFVTQQYRTANERKEELQGERKMLREEESARMADLIRLIKETGFDCHRDSLRSLQNEIKRRDNILESAVLDANALLTNVHRTRREMVKAQERFANHPYIKHKQYTRLCSVCFDINPWRRAALVDCGHLICLACAEKVGLDNYGQKRVFISKCCTHKTTFIALREHSEDDLPKRMRKGNNNSSSKPSH